MSQISCYRVMNRRGEIVNSDQDPKVELKLKISLCLNKLNFFSLSWTKILY